MPLQIDQSHKSPNHSSPYTFSGTDPALIVRVAVLEQSVIDQAATIAAIETELANISTEGLTPEDAEALRRLKAWLGVA